VSLLLSSLLHYYVLITSHEYSCCLLLLLLHDFDQDNPQHFLTHVNLHGCSSISGVGVQWLVEGTPVLNTLNIKGTKVSTITLSQVLTTIYRGVSAT
jgi:hypothetical protein